MCVFVCVCVYVRKEMRLGLPDEDRVPFSGEVLVSIYMVHAEVVVLGIGGVEEDVVCEE